MNNIVYNKIPQIVKDILFKSEGWLVGSSIEKLLKDEDVRDFDIVITDSDLYAKTISIYKENFMMFTTFGGIKLDINGVIIDIWHQSLSDFLIKSPEPGIIYNLYHCKNLINRTV